MNRLWVLAALPIAAGCVHVRANARRSESVDAPSVDSLYWRAVSFLDTANAKASTDSAIVLLDRYLVATKPAHKVEATALRKLAKDSQQLAKVSAALQQARNAAENRQSSERRDDDSVKEIERLKDELAKAKEELERIKKRLAAPPAGKPQL